MNDDPDILIPFVPPGGGEAKVASPRRRMTGGPRGRVAQEEPRGKVAQREPRGKVAQPRPRVVGPYGNGGGPFDGSGGGSGDDDGGPTGGTDPWRERKPRLRKLRLLAVLSGLGALALVSTFFGMMMAVASDLPQLENRAQYQHEANSFLYDDHGRPIGILEPPTHTVIVRYDQISPNMRRAVVAVEDKRFWTDPGFDLRGIARAVISDVTGGSHQGASTIAEQFVKNALSEQGNRTVFEKLREAALAFHLTHKWSKQKILTEYLNSVYFGNGAYGVESAARVYFGKLHGYDPNAASDGTTGGCGNGRPSKVVECASLLEPWEAALLAGMIASPGQFDPIQNPHAARARRDEVLRDMLDQHYISAAQYEQGINESLPTAPDIAQPEEPSAAPYFTSWVAPQVTRALEREGLPASVAQYREFYGGLKIHTSLDLSLQQAADQAVEQTLPYSSGQPTASLVAIDNHTGEVRAMVGGPIVNGHEDYSQEPFNLATQGHRQPGSAFKPFTLAVALEDGISPYSTWTSAPQDFIVPNSGGKEHFIVHNFNNQYSGVTTLQNATDYSDNSVFSQVGIKVGPRKVASLAKRMGIRSHVSHNYAMILGGLRVGVSPLDMAHAYETFATGGLRVYNPILGAPNQGPIGIDSIDCPHCSGIPAHLVNRPDLERILPPDIAHTAQTMLTGVVQSGTGTQAAISGVVVAGKTGTTTNYGDAWFVGWTPQMTVAVWVGFPNKLVSMSTLYNGQPVEGGTYPAIIWHSFMVQALQILAQESAGSKNGQTTTGITTTVLPAAPTGTVGPSTTATTTGPATTTTPPAAATQTTPSRTATPAPATGNAGGTAGGQTQGAGGTTNTGSTGGTAGNTGGTGLGTK